MGRTKGQQREHNDMIADARRTIRDAGIIDMLIDVAIGNPMAEYHPRTNPKQKHGKLKRLIHPNPDQRIRAMSELISRAYPQLKSVELDHGEGSGMVIKIVSSVDAPYQAEMLEDTASQVVNELNQRIEDAVLIGGDDA